MVDCRVEPDHQSNDLQNQDMCDFPTNDTSIESWLESEYNQDLRQQSTVRLNDFSESEGGKTATQCTLALLSGRMVADREEVNELFPSSNINL